jgi:hypothetical protein
MPVDRWNIKKTYPESLTNPLSFYVADVLDNRTDTEGSNLTTMIKEGDVFYFLDGNDFGIYNILSSSIYDRTKINQNHSQCAALQYMHDARDWKNFEFTVYIFCHSDGSGYFTIKGRGGKQHYINANCEAFAYICNIETSGIACFQKKQFEGAKFEQEDVSISGNLEDQWIGYKYCIYNDKYNDNNVHLELHIDVGANNNWQKVLTYTDRGGWGNQAEFCNADTPDQVGVWGGPVVTLKWVNMSSFQFKWLSIREINPYIPFNEGGSSANILYGYGGLGSTGTGGILRGL